jgi:hypothetical protein
MTCPFCSRDEGNNNGRSRIIATITPRIEDTARRVTNKPPGSCRCPKPNATFLRCPEILDGIDGL